MQSEMEKGEDGILKSLKGCVMAGDGYPWKVPTANVAVTLPEGMYRGEAWHEKMRLGNCAVWVHRHRPMIAETYVSGFEGDLYGEEIELRELQVIPREDLCKMYDKALG